MDDREMRTLIELKRWIRQKKVQARKERDKRNGKQQNSKMEESLQVAFSFE